MLKRSTYNFSAEPVRIKFEEKKAAAQAPPLESDENQPPQESEEDIKKRAEEEEKRRFNEAVESRVQEIISAQRESVNAEAESIINSAKKKAEDLTKGAETAAAQTLKNAKDESEQIKENARRKGFEEGMAKGKEESERKCQSYLDAAGQFLEEINSKKESYFISNEKELRETISWATEKIILERLENGDKMLERIIAQAAKNFRNSDFLRISVRGSEVSKELRTDKDYIKKIVGNIPDVEVEILPDDETPEGTVILDNDSEILDASIPTQLEFLREIIRNNKTSDKDD